MLKNLKKIKVLFINEIVNFLNWIGNCFKSKYKTIWTEDLPKKLQKKIIYIVGGKKYPFQAVFLCPKNCSKQIILNISTQHKKCERWNIIEHKNGTLSLYPSIWMKTLDCNCHYWFKKGYIIWTNNHS